MDIYKMNLKELRGLQTKLMDEPHGGGMLNKVNLQIHHRKKIERESKPTVQDYFIDHARKYLKRGLFYTIYESAKDPYNKEKEEQMIKAIDQYGVLSSKRKAPTENPQ